MKERESDAYMFCLVLLIAMFLAFWFRPAYLVSSPPQQQSVFK